MKKIFFIIAVLALIFHTGCNPLSQIEAELDSTKAPYSEDITYTLTDADYDQIYTLFKYDDNLSYTAKNVSKYKSFGPDREAAEFIPTFLSDKFRALNLGSTANITFNYSYLHYVTDDEQDTMGVYTEDPTELQLTAYVNFNFEAVENNIAVLIYYLTDGIDTTQKAVFFQYEGSQAGWVNQNAIFFSDSVLNIMNITSFNDEYPASVYIPLYLKNSLPYALSGDEQNVIYLENGHLYTDRYFFDGSKWSNIEQKTEQYVYSTLGWVFDPTINMTMSCDDYQLIVDWTNENKPQYMSPYPNTEYYFGASSYYCNFDMRVATRTANDPDGTLAGLSDEEVLDTLYNRLKEGINIMLQAKYPDAQPFVNGVPVYYNVHFQTYEPPRKNYVIKYLCTAPGQFEYIEGPTEE